MAVVIDSEPVIRHWPESMERFGKNPYGANLFRIVYSNSRHYMVSGEWDTGAVGAQWRPLYRNLPDRWILERWIPAEEFAQMSRQRWDREMQALGPWPERGEYNQCHAFLLGESPANANLDKLIRRIEEGRKRSFAENRQALKDDYDAETRENEQTIEDKVREKFPAFGFTAMVGRGGGRGTKTRPDFMKKASDLRLPQQAGKVITQNHRRTA